MPKATKKKLRLSEWIASEEEEQTQIFAWSAMTEGRYPELCLLHASMNGILTDARFGAKLKRLGRKKGTPDLFLPVSKRDADGNLRHAGLFIELKRKARGVVSAEQKAWHEQLRAQGYRVEVCHGAKAAIATITEYLGEDADGMD